MNFEPEKVPETAVSLSTASANVQPDRWRWLKRLVWSLLALASLLGALLLWLLLQINSAYLGGFDPLHMAAAQYTPKDVVGDLGGMKVTIPRHIPEMVEYDGDPGWGQKQKGPKPERAYNSKIRSFGFDLRYPDMATLSSSELRAEMKAQRLSPESMWISVVVTTGEFYPGDGALDRITYNDIEGSTEFPWIVHYTVRPPKQDGLMVYTLQDIDPHTRQPGRASKDAKDLYIARNAKGRVTTSIRCQVHGREHSFNCQHNFSMEYHGVKALIGVNYRRGLLQQWRDIQGRVTKLILTFKAQPESIETSQAVSATNGSASH